MKLYFKFLSGRAFEVDGFTNSDTIEKLKFELVPHLQDHMKCCKDLRMIFAGRSLEDGRTISDYNM